MPRSFLVRKKMIADSVINCRISEQPVETLVHLLEQVRAQTSPRFATCRISEIYWRKKDNMNTEMNEELPLDYSLPTRSNVLPEIEAQNLSKKTMRCDYITNYDRRQSFYCYNRETESKSPNTRDEYEDLRVENKSDCSFVESMKSERISDEPLRSRIESEIIKTPIIESVSDSVEFTRISPVIPQNDFISSDHMDDSRTNFNRESESPPSEEKKHKKRSNYIFRPFCTTTTTTTTTTFDISQPIDFRANQNKVNEYESLTNDAKNVSEVRSSNNNMSFSAATSNGDTSSCPSSPETGNTDVHQSKRQNICRFSCNECGKHYATSSNLSRHKQTHRSLDSESARQCPDCGKVYVSMPALSMHLLTHKLRHRCHICNKAFSRPWLLQGHLRSHSGERPYGCAHCGRAFADRSNLRAHMQTHSDRRQYSCSRCQKSFSLKSYLNKHYESACIRTCMNQGVIDE